MFWKLFFMKMLHFTLLNHSGASEATERCLESKILKIAKELNLLHPYVLWSSTSKDVSIMKKLSLEDQYSNLKKELKELYKIPVDEDHNQNVIAVIESNNIPTFVNDLKILLKVSTTAVLIVLNGGFDIEDFYSNIGQAVYFYNISSNEVFEKYQINGIKIQQSLGFYRTSFNEFFWTKSITKEMVKRRSNFHGLTLKAMAEFSGLNMVGNSDYLTKAPYFNENQTYLINGFTSGYIDDIFQIMQQRLNFTASIYKRKVTSWGKVLRHDNGTLEGIGIIGDLFHRKADLIGTYEVPEH